MDPPLPSSSFLHTQHKCLQAVPLKNVPGDYFRTCTLSFTRAPDDISPLHFLYRTTTGRVGICETTQDPPHQRAVMFNPYLTTPTV